MLRSLGGVALLGLGGVLACATLGPVLPAEAEWPPDLLGVTPTGESIHLPQYRGKLVLISFWASWCPPCREELPRVEKFHRAFRDNGLAVVAVNVGETSCSPSSTR